MKFNVEFPGGWTEEVDSITVKGGIANYHYQNGSLAVQIHDYGDGYIVNFPDDREIKLDYGQMAALLITMKALTTAGKGSLVEASLVRQDKPIKVEF